MPVSTVDPHGFLKTTSEALKFAKYLATVEAVIHFIGVVLKYCWAFHMNPLYVYLPKQKLLGGESEIETNTYV